jgi:hypothetical protein
MYLKGWETIANGRNKQICVYEKNLLPTFKSRKEEVGYRENYYLDKTEKWLDKELENKTSLIFEKLEKQLALDQEEKLKLAQFMFVIWQRVPFNIEGLFKDVNDLSLKHILAPFRKWQKVLGIKYNDFEKAYMTKERYKEVYSELLMRETLEQRSYITKMNWLFIKASQKNEFVISDNPFIFDRRIGIGNYLYGYILFPINRNTVLLCTHFKLPKNDYEECSKAINCDINRRIISNSYSQVYASFKSGKFSEFVNEFIGKDLSNKHSIITSH